MQPLVLGVKVNLENWTVRPMADSLRVGLHGPPCVHDEGVLVINRLDAGRLKGPVWAFQHDRQRTREGLDVVVHVTKSGPDEVRRLALASKPTRGMEL